MVNMDGLKLVNEQGHEVKVGDKVTDMHGDVWVLKSARGPSGGGSDAKVYVVPFSGDDKDAMRKDRVGDSGREFYARVFGLRWIGERS